MSLSKEERRELIGRYERGPKQLREAFARVPEEARTWRPGPGKWSAHEVVVHCADSEANSGLRIRYVLAEKDPVILGYDQDEWARALDYHSQPLEPAFAAVEAARGRTVPLLRLLLIEAQRPLRDAGALRDLTYLEIRFCRLGHRGGNSLNCRSPLLESEYSRGFTSTSRLC